MSLFIGCFRAKTSFDLLAEILFECKGSSVGVLVSGPKKMRHEVATICSSGLAENMHFESISFSWWLIHLWMNVWVTSVKFFFHMFFVFSSLLGVGFHDCNCKCIICRRTTICWWKCSGSFWSLVFQSFFVANGYSLKTHYFIKCLHWFPYMELHRVLPNFNAGSSDLFHSCFPLWANHQLSWLSQGLVAKTQGNCL